MNRPIIKGTSHHKASIAKAKTVVAQTRTKADPSLVWAGEELGKSYMPKEIDYTIDQPKIKIPKKKELTEEEKAARDARREARRQARKDRKTERDAEKSEKKRIKNLQKEYEKEHPEGTLFPDGKYYDAQGNEIKNKTKKVKKVKEPKVKKEKEPRIKKDTWYRDVDEDGNVITRGWQSIKDKIKAKRKQKELDFQAKQKEKERIQTEKDAAYIGKGDHEIARESYKGSKEELAYIKEQERIAVEAKRKQMSKKEVIKVGPPETTAIGGKQIQQYTKEQKERLATEGVWNDDAEKIVLPEEVDKDGSYTPKGEGTIIEPIEISSEKRSEMTVPTAGLVKPNRRDFKNSSDYMKARMNYYKALESEQSKTVMQMRDDRIYKHAIKDGKVQANMRKSGYIPYNER